MKKNLFKVVASCAAVCFVSGLVLLNGTADTSKASDGYICNYTYDDGKLGESLGNSCTISIQDGLNSNFDDPSKGMEDGSCVKISGRKGYWETAAFRYDLGNLEVGKKYTISYDVYHENDAKDTSNGSYNAVRAVILHTQPDWGQIGQPIGVEKGEWERVSWDYTPTKDQSNYWLYIEFAYPEATDNNEYNAYTDENLEDYYIDNFSIRDYVEPTPTPVPATPTPATPTPAPATPVPVTSVPVPVPVPVEDEGLDVGYEEAVKGITYVVTGKDTVAVVGFDVPKAKLTIPATVKIEDATYKVTAIKNNAFKGESDIKSAVIGANVTSIGKSAFYKCSSLKKITIKSSAVKTIGKKAFNGVNKKAAVSVPKAKKAAYKKLLKSAGLPKKATVK